VTTSRTEGEKSVTTREADFVELVDPEGLAVGQTTVGAAHVAPGLLHRAFSVFLRDPSGRVLLQQRAAVKTRFPLRWANTCCGHPAPNETPAAAAARRLSEEVGITGVTLSEVGVYSYYAEDPQTGRVEYEYDHVLLGDVEAGVSPSADPEEVADLRWVDLDDLASEIGREPRAYAPWLRGVADCLQRHLDPDDAAEPSGGR
jgi:isopentenyl-diphosphate Delta-isomerase